MLAIKTHIIAQNSGDAGDEQHRDECQEAGPQGAKDREIGEYAGKYRLILVIQDQKPPEFAQLLGVKCVFISNLMIAKLIDEKIKQLCV